MDGSYPSWLRAYSVRVWFKDDPSGAGVQIILQLAQRHDGEPIRRHGAEIGHIGPAVGGAGAVGDAGSAPFNARNMIDGDFQTHWTASNNWSRDEHVIVTFTEPVDLSTALWAPRMDGSYPSWLRAYSVRVWWR